jgi:hypothetical protein
MQKSIKTKLISASYLFLIITLAVLVYAIAKERYSQIALESKKIQKPIIEEKPDEPPMSLTQKTQIVAADCANQCKSFKNNPEDLQYCQEFCKLTLK